MIFSKAGMALLLSSIAGFSTLLGFLIVLICKKKTNKILSIGMGFSAGVMISVSLLDLLPISINEFHSLYYEKPKCIFLSILFGLLGVGLAALLNKFFPERLEKTENDKNNLFKVGLISMIAIVIHNIPEGIATFASAYKDIGLGLSVTVAIAIHNIPEGMCVAMPIYYSTNSKKKAFFYTFIAGVSEPIGALIALVFLSNYLTPFLMGSLFAMISGIMLFIALTELLPTSRLYGYKKAALVSTIIGACLMPLTFLI